MKRTLTWFITAALLVTAGVVTQLTPFDGADEAGFVVAASIGEPATGRDLAVTITDVRAADAVTAEDGWRAEGTWVVVDLDAASVRAQRGVSLGGATLQIGERTYRATERATTLFRSGLVPGIPQRGSIAFELPEGALVGPAVLRMAVNADMRLDSVVELDIEMSELSVSDEIELTPTGWAGL